MNNKEELIKYKDQKNELKEQLLSYGFTKNPRNESFSDMIRFQVFPHFRFSSLTFLMVVLEVVIFIYGLVFYDQVPSDLDQGFLALSQQALFDLGELYPYYIVENGQYHRILFSIFLHANLYHLFFSVFVKLYFFSFIESKLGFWKSLHFYILQGLAGSLFNALISDEPGVVGSVGASVHSYSLQLENILYSFRPKGNFNFFQNHYQSQFFKFYKSVLITIIQFLIHKNYPNILFSCFLFSSGFNLILIKYFNSDEISRDEENLPDQLDEEHTKTKNKRISYAFLIFSYALILSLFFTIIYQRKPQIIPYTSFLSNNQ